MPSFTSFTDLPAEMRNIIYDGLCTDTNIKSGFGSNSLALLRTSRLVHQEAASYFYQHKSFTVSLPAAESKGATILPPIADGYLKYLRQLTICTTIGQSGMVSTRETARSMANLTSIGSYLEVLNFKFSSQTSRILQSRVDDSVLHYTHPITYALRTLLTFDVAKLLRVELENVWFATGVAENLQSEFGNRLEIVAILTGKGIERALTGQYSTTHLRTLGINEQDAQDAEYLQSGCLYGGSMPSSLGSVLSELNVFSPIDFLDEEPDDLQDVVAIEKADSGFGAQVFDMDEEELNESDDVNDEEMEDIDGIDAIVGNLKELEMRRVNEQDVCYMTNFAPGLLGNG